MLRRTMPILLATAAGLSAAAAAGTGNAPQADRGGQIVVRTGPHWMPALPLAANRSFACNRYDVSYQLTYRATSAGPRLEMQRLTVDGRDVDAEWLVAVNSILADFSSPPDVTPECTRRQIRITLAQMEGGGVARSERVPLELP